MIEVTDLMVHNYIEYKGEVFFIQDISMLQGRYCSNLFKSRYESFATRHNVLISEMEPIEITEQWLVDLGFKKWNIMKGNEITYSNGKMIIHKRKRGWVIHKKRKEPKYIHELQNIASCFYNIALNTNYSYIKGEL